MAKKLDHDALRIRTPIFRASFVNLLQPRKYDDGKQEYCGDIVLPEDDDFWADLEDRIEIVGDAYGRSLEELQDSGKYPIKTPKPFKGESEIRPEFQGMNTCTVRNRDPIPVLDQYGNPTQDRSLVYSGAWYYALVKPGWWKKNGGGVSVYGEMFVRADTPAGESDSSFGRGNVDVAKTFGDVIKGGGSASGSGEGGSGEGRRRRRRQRPADDE